MAIKLKTRNAVEEEATLNKGRVLDVEQAETDLRVAEIVANVVRMKPEADNAKKITKKYEDEYKKLKDYADGDPSDEYTFETEEGTVTFGAVANKTEVTDMDMVRKILGDEVFMKLCSIPVTKLKDYMSKAELDKCTSTERSGTRSIKSALRK